MRPYCFGRLGHDKEASAINLAFNKVSDMVDPFACCRFYGSMASLFSFLQGV